MELVMSIIAAISALVAVFTSITTLYMWKRARVATPMDRIGADPINYLIFTHPVQINQKILWKINKQIEQN